MTPAQSSLLADLIVSEQGHWRRKLSGEPAHSDERGIEISYLSGVSLKTARSLEREGLVEILDSSLNGNLWVFLGSSTA